MHRHRRHSTEFKREVIRAYLDGESLYGPAKQHVIDRSLVRLQVRKYECAEVEAANTLHEYEAKIARLGTEFPANGYRRVTARLRHDELVVNHKRGMRIMREQGPSVRPRHCFVITTGSLARERLRDAALPRHNYGTQPTRLAGPFPS